MVSYSRSNGLAAPGPERGSFSSQMAYGGKWNLHGLRGDVRHPISRCRFGWSGLCRSGEGFVRLRSERKPAGRRGQRHCSGTGSVVGVNPELADWKARSREPSQPIPGYRTDLGPAIPHRQARVRGRALRHFSPERLPRPPRALEHNSCLFPWLDKGQHRLVAADLPSYLSSSVLP